MENALVTGANGFLGRHLVKGLNSYYTLHTLSRHTDNHYPVDLSMQAPALTTNYNLVVHAAANAHIIPSSQQETASFFEVNEQGTRNLCKGFDDAGFYPDQFVFISTVAVYGLEKGILITEDTSLNGSSPYAKSKINAELFLQDWCKAHDVLLTIFRLPLIAGKNPPGNLGNMITAIKKGRYFTIGNGDARKSIVLASDVAACIRSAARAGGIYHLTDGGHPTMAELAGSIAKLLDKPCPKSIPLWLATAMAKVGNSFGVNAIINMAKLEKIKATLTFDDTRAQAAFGWKALSVTQHITIY